MAQFEEALDTVYPPITAEARRTRYAVTQQYFPKNAVPLDRLASIVCYLALLTTHNNHWVPVQLVKGFLTTVEIEENGWVKTRPDRRFGSMQNLQQAAEGDDPDNNKSMNFNAGDALMGMDGDDGQGSIFKELEKDSIKDELPHVQLVALSKLALQPPEELSRPPP